MNPLIEIPGQTTVWRYDQIAAVELVDSTLTIIPVTGEPRDYEYEEEDDAGAAFIKVMSDWKTACKPETK